MKRSDTTSQEDNGSSRVIAVVFFTLLLDLLGFTLILPLLPSILDHYGQTEDAVYQSLQSVVDWFREAIGAPIETKCNTVLFGGLIGSLFSLLQFLSSPLTGAASDYYGRRPLMMLTTVGIPVSSILFTGNRVPMRPGKPGISGCIFSALHVHVVGLLSICTPSIIKVGLMSSYALWALSRSFSMFLLSRVVGGICKGNVSLCTAVVADLSCSKARSRGMAMIGVAFSVGFTVGPLIGAYFARRSSLEEVFYLGPALLALFFSTSDLLFIFLMLPETLHKDTKASSMSSGIQGAGDLMNPVALFHFSAVTRREDSPSKERMENLKALGLVYFSYIFLFSGLEFTLSFLTHQRFQFTSMDQGKMFFFIGITMAVIQGGYARRIKPGHQIKTVEWAIISLIPAFILIGLACNLTMLYMGLFLYSFAAAVVVPCLSAQVSEYGLATQKGTVMGILRSLGALARALGPILASSVYWLAGSQACFVVSSAFFVLPLLLLRRQRWSKQE